VHILRSSQDFFSFEEVAEGEEMCVFQLYCAFALQWNKWKDTILTFHSRLGTAVSNQLTLCLCYQMNVPKHLFLARKPSGTNSQYPIF